MYLPLASLAVLGVAGGYELLRKLFPASSSRRKTGGIALTVAVIVSLGALTVLRNADYRSAIGMWEKVIRQRPGNPRARNSLGNLELKLGNTEGAFELYRSAIAIDPDYQPGLYNLANLLASRGDLAGAIRFYRKTLEINPNAVEAHNNLGVALFGRGEKEEALAHFRQAMRIDPADPAAYYNLGLALFKEGRNSEASGFLEKALELRPDYLPARTALQAVRERLRDRDRSRKVPDCRRGHRDLRFASIIGDQ